MKKNIHIISNLIQQIIKTPFIVRLIFVTLIGIQILNWKTNDYIFMELALNNSFIVSPYQVWRIIVGWLCQPSKLTLLLIILSGWPFLTKFQYKNSSVVLFNDFLVNNFLFSTIFFLTQFTLFKLYYFQSKCSFTIVAIWMNFISKCCFYNSHVQFPVYYTKYTIQLFKYYPFCIYLLLWYINYTLRFDATIGLVFAMIECAKFNGGLILFTKDTYQKKQSYFQCTGLTKLSCWQPLDSNKIKQNHRLTVSSSQFYLDLYPIQPNAQLPHDEPLETTHLDLSSSGQKINNI